MVLAHCIGTKMQGTSAADAIANLDRLAQKSGVQSTLILARETGAIVQSSGLESSDVSGDPDVALAANTKSVNGHADTGKNKTAEDVARLVYKFVTSASEMARELNGTQEDELKLLRLRTKRNELVIVPDARYIAVVIHDTPPA